MTAPTKFTGTVKVWTTSKWRGIESVLHSVAEGHLDEAVSQMTYTNHDMSTSEDWTEVGIAEITVMLYPRDVVVEKELSGLKQQLEKVRAENHMRENAILDRISKLQAITYTGELHD
jgi:hypothetical protein